MRRQTIVFYAIMFTAIECITAIMKASDIRELVLDTFVLCYFLYQYGILSLSARDRSISIVGGRVPFSCQSLDCSHAILGEAIIFVNAPLAICNMSFFKLGQDFFGIKQASFIMLWTGSVSLRYINSVISSNHCSILPGVPKFVHMSASLFVSILSQGLMQTPDSDCGNGA